MDMGTALIQSLAASHGVEGKTVADVLMDGLRAMPRTLAARKLKPADCTFYKCQFETYSKVLEKWYTATCVLASKQPLANRQFDKLSSELFGRVCIERTVSNRLGLQSSSSIQKLSDAVDAKCSLLDNPNSGATPVFTTAAEVMSYLEGYSNSVAKTLGEITI